jgi:hypothetical protein
MNHSTFVRDRCTWSEVGQQAPAVVRGKGTDRFLIGLSETTLAQVLPKSLGEGSTPLGTAQVTFDRTLPTFLHLTHSNHPVTDSHEDMLTFALHNLRR